MMGPRGRVEDCCGTGATPEEDVWSVDWVETWDDLGSTVVPRPGSRALGGIVSVLVCVAGGALPIAIEVVKLVVSVSAVVVVVAVLVSVFGVSVMNLVVVGGSQYK
jgi:hypothetical protein